MRDAVRISDLDNMLSSAESDGNTELIGAMLIKTQKMIDASSCVHHFVSSWMTHDKQAHTSTLEERKVAGTPVVPKAQSFRTTNEWRSFELEKSAAKGRREGVDQRKHEQNVAEAAPLHPPD